MWSNQLVVATIVVQKNKLQPQQDSNKIIVTIVG
jgi:hypothetical protein